MKFRISCFVFNALLGTVAFSNLIFCSPVTEAANVFCNSPADTTWTSIDKPVKTCSPGVNGLKGEKFQVVSSDPLIGGISFNHLKNVHFLPQNLASFSELIAVNIFNCSVKTIDYHDFMNLWKLRSLHIASNEVAFVSSDAFKDLVSLETIYLSNNKIQFLDSKIFKSQRNLKKLYLGGNLIEFLHPNIFKPLANINAIYLNDNKLLSINENIFENSPKLKNISLATNNLVEIPENLFSSNLKLEYAWFNPNKIKFVKPETFERLDNLKLISFSGNACVDKYYWSSAFDDMKKDLKEKCASNETKIEDKNKNLEIQIATLADAHGTLMQEVQKMRLEIAALKHDVLKVNQTAHGIAIVF